MPIDYEIIEDKKLFLAKGIGTISGNDVIRHLEELSEDDKYVAPMKKLIDYRLVEKLSILYGQAMKIAQLKRELSSVFKGKKCAFISPGDLTYRTSRVHQSLIDDCPDLSTEVFRSVEETLDWLKVKLDHEI
jgi:hypothetical protein